MQGYGIYVQKSAQHTIILNNVYHGTNKVQTDGTDNATVITETSNSFAFADLAVISTAAAANANGSLIM